MSNDNTQNTGNMIQLTGLWVNESKSGNGYMLGYLGNARLMIFRNMYKTEDKHPDYVAYLAPKLQAAADDPGDGQTMSRDMNDIPF